MGSHTVCTHWLYLPVVNIGLKMALYKPKHVAKKLIYWCCVKIEQTILLHTDEGISYNIY